MWKAFVDFTQNDPEASIIAGPKHRTHSQILLEKCYCLVCCPAVNSPEVTAEFGQVTSTKDSHLLQYVGTLRPTVKA